MKTPAFILLLLSAAACGSNASDDGQRFMDSGPEGEAGALGPDRSAMAGGADAIADVGTTEDAGRSESGAIDAGRECFPCAGRWICGGDISQVDLKPEIDGCYLSGLPGRNLLAPDGTVTIDGSVVGRATGTGARVSVAFLDGGLWLFCAAGGGCPR